MQEEPFQSALEIEATGWHVMDMRPNKKTKRQAYDSGTCCAFQ